ncbi:hypothetical protein [Sphingobium sp. CFD-1]|uniref:hypothetical protein n=1 Tax=Sphingobium sp. CFD-1 TaxID=2878545 RepID=UPI00214AA908|nr:hypothetical protein [Sphingobium sp. CFD-1]
MTQRNNVLQRNVTLTQSSMLAAVSSIIVGAQADTGDTDQDMADKLGCSAGTVANARNRKAAMNMLTVMKIGEVYGLDRLAPLMHLIGGKLAPEAAVCTSDRDLPIGAARGQMFLAEALADNRIDDSELASGAEDIEAAGQVFDALRYRLNVLRASGIIVTRMGGR